MNKKEFYNLIENEILLLDGATGTELQKEGLPTGVCPEKWIIEHSDVILKLQKEYVESGSKVIYAPTFGANRLKLEDYNLEDEIVNINKTLVKLSKKAAGEKAYVAGDLSPTGKSIYPLSKYKFEDIVNVYKEQVNILVEAGVDLFVIETMMSLQEARAALIAVKECCDLPAIVSMTYESNNRTLHGTDPISALVTLQSLGADAVGCNCSTGPKDMIPIVREMSKYAKVPLMVKPNAGLPKLVNGVTEFDMEVDEFVNEVLKLLEMNVHIVGGCCGTNPKYIKALKEALKEIKPRSFNNYEGSIISSEREYVEFKDETIIIGERINPTGKKKLQEALKTNNFEYVTSMAKEQIAQGAKVLDVNVGMNNINEPEVMEEVIYNLTSSVHAPLCIDSSNIEAIEKALRVYPGRALVNSISLEKHKIEQLLPITAKYGAMFILLPLNDDGLPKSKEDKENIIKEIISNANKYGFTNADILVDGLVVTVASNPRAAIDVLETISWCHNEIGINTVIGLSNISFGLPQRSFVNAAFLAMAINNGLSAAIANPSNEIFMGMKYATDLLVMKDTNSEKYIDKYGDKKKEQSTNENLVFSTIVEGEKEQIISNIDKLLKDNIEPQTIVDEFMIPAITEVGRLFEEDIYFLPQLIRSAETMETGLKRLEPLLFEESVDNNTNKPKIVLATVKGDVHDIGKNLVALMLKNHGFDVIDLGKNVDREIIIKTAKEEKASLIGLSALMTTTMLEMKEVIRRVKEEQLNVKVLVGGAVITEEYAKEIGAIYSKDAQDAVNVALNALNTLDN